MSRQRYEKISSYNSDKVFLIINDAILLLSVLIVIYPLIYILSSSFSDPYQVSIGKVVLWPVQPSIAGYKEVFKYKPVLTGFLNTLLYTSVGTVVNVLMTILAAYPLSRRTIPGRRALIFIFTFTMIFSGGLIPSYILNSQLSLINTRAVMIIPVAMSVYNMIVARSFFETTIPNEMYEAATIDGCSHFRFLLSVVLPLSKAVIAVLTLFYAVNHWNSYFQAFVYLNDKVKYPLQIILRDILIMNSTDYVLNDPELYVAKQGMADLLKYSLIVVSSIPFLVVYPFVSKNFVKGVMLGSVKG